MDPVSVTLIGAFVAGASKGAAKVGQRAVVDAYDAFRHLVVTGYAKAVDLFPAITAFEAKPESEARQGVLAEELKAAGALDDATLVTAAERVLAAAEHSGLAIGLDWTDIKAAQLKIGKIRARAGSIGFRAARMEITGSVEIPEIDVGGGARGN
jgi:hypothetical protein